MNSDFPFRPDLSISCLLHVSTSLNITLLPVCIVIFYKMQFRIALIIVVVWVRIFILTPLSLVSLLWDICKQNSPRCDAAERGVQSGAILLREFSAKN